MNNRKGVLTLIFNPRVLLLHTPTHSWVGEGRPSKTGEGKAAEMSHQDRKRERGKETEMRDTKRDSYWKDREGKTHIHTPSHHHTMKMVATN